MKTQMTFLAVTISLLFLISCEWETTQPGPPPMQKVFHVPSDKATIQDAIDAIDKDSTGFEIIVAKGTYDSAGFWDLDFDGRKFIELRSESGPDSTIINLKRTHRAFSFKSGEDATTVIRGFTFKSGRAPGEGNTLGGAVYISDAHPLFVDCIFSDNSASYGGAVYSDAAKPIFDSCRFVDNSAKLGGAVYGLQDEVHLRNCVFVDNYASNKGGAIYSFTARAFVTGSLFDGNKAAGDGLGGAIYANQSSPLFENCILIENESIKGGVLYSTGLGSRPRFTNCTLVENSADSGSALFAGAGSSLRINSTIIAFGNIGAAVELSDGSGEPRFECCDIYANDGGDWDTDSILEAQLGTEGNISLDPLLCDKDNKDMRLQADSPCLPDSNGCGQIGAQVGICE